MVHSTDVLITMDTIEDCWLETPCVWHVSFVAVEALRDPW